MNVKLVSGTPEAEKFIGYCARVSNPSNQDNHETAPKLLKYLIDHEHWSPFEMAHMVLEIETSRAVSAQILRHRSFSFQEFSQRYSDILEFEEIEFRKQATNNRQSSEEVIYPFVDKWQDDTYSCSDTRCGDSVYIAQQNYHDLITQGVSRETARMVLPLCVKTRLYMAGNIRSWIHYIKLRTKPDTQKEHRLVAEECKKIFILNLPIISSALNFT